MDRKIRKELESKILAAIKKVFQVFETELDEKSDKRIKKLIKKIAKRKKEIKQAV